MRGIKDMQILRFEDADFPIEAYLIDFREKSRRRAKNAILEDKLKILKQLCLMDVFLYRLKMDPGFYSHICEELVKNNQSFQLTYLFLHNKYHFEKNYGDDLLYNISVSNTLTPDYFGDTSSIDSWDVSRPNVPHEIAKKLANVLHSDKNNYDTTLSNLKEEINKYRDEIENPLDKLFYSLHLSNYLVKNISPQRDLNSKNAYLKEQLERARSNNNEERAYAIKSLMDEYLSNRLQINGLFGDRDFFIDISGDYSEFWDYIAKKYFISW
jgi:hypothetical protein